MEKIGFGMDENLRKGLEATEQVSVEKLEAGLKENHEQALSGAEKEEVWQRIKDEVRRDEEGAGGTRGTEEEVAEAKEGGEEFVNKKTEAEKELRSTLDIAMEKYKAEKPAEKDTEITAWSLESAKTTIQQRNEFIAEEVKKAEKLLEMQVGKTGEEKADFISRIRGQAKNLFDGRFIDMTAGLTKEDIKILADAENPYNLMGMSPEEKSRLYAAQTKISEAREKLRELEAEEVKQMWTTEDKITAAIFDQVRRGGVEAKRIKEARIESGLRQKSLDGVRERLASLKPEDPKYAELKKDYEAQIDFAKYNLVKNRQSTLESKGLLIRETGKYKKLITEEVQVELDKYTKEVIVPHFAVVEAAKIQALRSEANPSLLEKMKDNKFSKLAYGAIDAYRKAGWKKKAALSVGLFGAGSALALTGGTVGLALAGIVTGGKGIQRFLSGAGMAVATEALIQRSQQRWMEKEGWGKNRHEYIAKQIASLRESEKKGGALSETEIEKSLSEREAMEKSNEVNRAILAGITGTLVGSGTLWQAVKQYGEWLGFSGAPVPEKGQLLGHKIEVPAEEKATHFVEIEKPIKLEIGVRGPEGAIIDELKNNPELAKKFGWDGDTDISEWAGAKAHTLWMASAEEMRGDPTRISKGSIFLDPENGGSIKLGDTEYLKSVAGQATAATEGPIPTDTESGATPEAPAEDLFNVPDYGTDVHDRSPSAQLNAGDRVLADLVDQEKINEFNVFGEKYMDDLKKIMSADYIEQNKDYYIADMVEKAKQGGIDFESMLNTEKLQEVMDSPLGKFGAITSKFAAIEQKDLGATIARMGGMKEFMKMKVSELYGPDGLPSRDIAVNKLAMELSRLTGGDLERRGGSTLKEIFDSIKSKEIFGGSAEELVKKGKR